MSGGRKIAESGGGRGRREEAQGKIVQRMAERWRGGEELRWFEGKSSKLGQGLLITVWGAVPGRRAVPSARV